MRLLVASEISEATAAAFAARVEGCQDAEIEVLIDCPGGLLDAAFVMANALHAAKAHTTAILARADSAALCASLGADRRVAARDGTALLHDMTIEMPRSLPLSATDLQRLAHAAEHTKRDLSLAFERMTGVPDSTWRALMSRSARLTAEAMLKHGLVSEISPWPKSYLRAQFSNDDRTAGIAAFFERHMPEIEAAVTSGRRARVMPEIVFSPEDLASYADLSRKSLKRLQHAHARIRNSNPTEHGAALGSECEPDCLLAGFEQIAQRQINSVEGLLRGPERRGVR